MNTCLFNPDRTHRFTLTSIIDADNPRMVQFIGLNPSTADESTDDPTVRRCKAFARRWGFGVFVMTNLFSLRSTDPRGLRFGDVNDRLENIGHIGAVAGRADLIVCAWGVHGAWMGRNVSVAGTLRANGHPLHCLGRTKGGHPRHPLYLRADTPLEVYE